MLVAAGALVAGSKKRTGTQVLGALLALVVAGASGAVFGAGAAVDALAACAIALAVVFVAARGRLTAGATCVVAAAGAALVVGADAALAAMESTTLTDSFVGLVSELAGPLASAYDLSSMDVDLVAKLVGLLWPSAYVMVAAIEVACAFAGAAFAASRLCEPAAEFPRFSAFDLPLWVVTIFVAAVVGIAADLTVASVSNDALLMVTGNLLLGLRCALAAQGFAVLVWHMQERNTPAVAFALAAIAAAYLEVQFIVMSVVGLLDVWSNFRRLPRGKKVHIQDEPEQQQGSAHADRPKE